MLDLKSSCFRREHGFAMVAAVAAVAAFGFISFEVLAADRGVIAGVSARVEQARLSAAADAGVMMAIHGISQEDASQRWAIDGRPREVVFRGVDLVITIVDERGKAPLDGLNPAQSRALFQGAGATADRLDALVDELRDFQSADDDDDTNTPAKTNAQDLAAAPLRHGGFRTVGDLMALKDMDADLYSHIAPAVTVFFEESGPFERGHASPLAASTMRATENESPEEQQLDQTDDQNPTETIEDENMIGRSVTVSVVARGPYGAQTHRSAIVELTGSGSRNADGSLVGGDTANGKAHVPYWIRYVE